MRTIEVATVYRGTEKIAVVESDTLGEVQIVGQDAAGADLMVIDMAAPAATISACAAMAYDLGIDCIYEAVVSGQYSRLTPRAGGE